MSEERMEAFVEVAKAAGAAVLEVYQRGFEVVEKDDKSPLTEADLASHRIIVEALGRLTPDWPVLSEEGRSIPYQVRSGWERYWLIDPLDGTREFVKRNGEFTVNIALVENGRPTLGVVYAPVLQRCYWGQRGQGAWRQDGDRPAERIAVTCPAAQPRRIVASRSHAGDSLGGMLDRIGPHEVVSMGSSLKLCLVAEGAADFYPRLGPTSEWDTAAAQAVVEAAGGCVTDTAGANLRYNSKESLLNPHFLVFGDPEVPWTSYL